MSIGEDLHEYMYAAKKGGGEACCPHFQIKLHAFLERARERIMLTLVIKRLRTCIHIGVLLFFWEASVGKQCLQIWLALRVFILDLI